MTQKIAWPSESTFLVVRATRHHLYPRIGHNLYTMGGSGVTSSIFILCHGGNGHRRHKTVKDASLWDCVGKESVKNSRHATLGRGSRAPNWRTHMSYRQQRKWTPHKRNDLQEMSWCCGFYDHSKEQKGVRKLKCLRSRRLTLLPRNEALFFSRRPTVWHLDHYSKSHSELAQLSVISE